MDEEIEQIDPEADVIPDCRFGIRAMPVHARHWFRTFVPIVAPEPQVGIDDRKLARKYSLIYQNIQAMSFESVFRSGDTVNMNMVKEFYANSQPEGNLDVVYKVEIRGKMIPFSSHVNNMVMGFTHSHKQFHRFLRRPDYPDIRRHLCGADSTCQIDVRQN